jgi:glutaryl-CoA dehydrogenase (non-decarboxylating)
LHSPGVTRGNLHGKLGMRAGSTGWIAFQDVRVPLENRIGEQGEGFKITMSAFDHGRYTVAAGAVGIIRASLAASGLRPRAQGLWQADWRLSTHSAENCPDGAGLRNCALLYWQVGWMKNLGQRPTLQTSYAKKFATEAASRSRQPGHPGAWRVWLQRRVRPGAPPAQQPRRDHL